MGFFDKDLFFFLNRMLISRAMDWRFHRLVLSQRPARAPFKPACDWPGI